MTQQLYNNKILIIHGPNMNLIGHRIKGMTLDKLNKHLRNLVKEGGFEVKFFQTNAESDGVNLIQRHRNKIKGIVLFPGSWQKSAYAIQDSLEILSIPFITISTGEKVNLLKGLENFDKDNMLKRCTNGINFLLESL